MKTTFFNLNKSGYNVDYFYNHIKPTLEEYHIKSFNLGCSFPEEIDKEEYKKGFQAKLTEKLAEDFELKRDLSDITITIDFRKDLVSYDIRSIFLYGTYNKYSRDLPQTIYYCHNCYGRGCDNCNNTGRLKETSVQEIISPYLENLFDSQKSNFIGSGREDINVRMLGNGREFLIELFNPMFREKTESELKSIEEKINNNHPEIKISNLRMATEKDIDSVKNSKHQKIYRAIIESSLPISDLNILLKEYQIKQQTPKRVSKRRANLVRERFAKITNIKKISAIIFSIDIIADSGLYIKEFISGDDNRSIPSISQILNCSCECKELDVIEIIR